MLIEALESLGIDPACLVEGLPVSLEQLRDPARRIDWDLFAAMNDNLARELGSPLALERVGERIVHVPSYDFLRRLVGYVITPRQMHLAGQRFLLPMLFPHLQTEMEDVAGGRLRLTATLPPGLRECGSFFRVCAGSLAAVTTLLDQPTTLVDVQIAGRRVVYEMTLPRAPSLPERLVRLARAVAGPGPALEALAQQQRALVEDYERLMRVRHDFRHMLESIPSGVVIHRDGALLWVNKAVVAMLGYDRLDEVVGKPVLSFIHPGDAQRLLAQLAKPIEAAPRAEYRMIRKDGQTIVIDMAPAREVEFAGAPARLVVGEDVTEKRRMQDRLLVADRMAALGMVAAGVAHEINNPLAFAHASLELAAEELAGRAVDIDRVSDAVATAREGLSRVRAIAGDLRTFSRPEGDRAESVEIRTLLESTLHLAAGGIQKRARLVREYGEVPNVQASRARLGQVFLNLLINAAEAMPEPDPARHVIRVRTRTDQLGRAVVEIADTGVGVPEADSGRVFEPFFTTKRASKGTGLGLSVCHRIVTGYGGEIRVVSPTGEPPFRTVFRVALPAA